MTKLEIIAAIAEKTGLPKVDVLVIVEAYFKEVKSSLIEGEPVYIRGFGGFVIKKHAAKTGRNIRGNTLVAIPEQFKPAFKPAKDFFEGVRVAKHNGQE